MHRRFGNSISRWITSARLLINGTHLVRHWLITRKKLSLTNEIENAFLINITIKFSALRGQRKTLVNLRAKR